MICNNDIHWDTETGSYQGAYNPDSVMVDTCTGSNTYNKRFAKKYFILQFSQFFYPFDTILKPHIIKTVNEISNSKPNLKIQFKQMESLYGTIYFQGNLNEYPDDSTLINPVLRLYFESNQNTDEIISTFKKNIDSLNDVIYQGRYGIPISDVVDSKNNIISLLIYPNPVNDIIIFQGFKDKQRLQFSILNIIGQKLFESELTEQIDVSYLKSGVYFLRIGNMNYKFVKL
jgi:hypothetical protein